MSNIVTETSGADRATYGGPGECYRYTLIRELEDLSDTDGDPTLVLWIMLNPSTATAARNDPTVAKCQTFSRRWGFDRMAVANLFALRSTDPGALRRHPDPTGDPENLNRIIRLAAVADRIVCAWGNHGALGLRAQKVLSALRHYDLHALRVNRTGHPAHPLYLPFRLPLMPWTPGKDTQ